MLDSQVTSAFNRVFVTGCAGFIGSNIVDRVLREGYAVVGWDNFSTGQHAFLEHALRHGRFRLVEGDNLDLSGLTKASEGCDFVFHLAANADVRSGLDHPKRDLEQNTIATFNVLEAMRENGIRSLAFASTGSIYGEADVIPTPETAPFPVQTSFYGASKLACEGLVQAYCEGFGLEAYIFRFVSILGERYSHGHVFDFYRQLLEHPTYLKVLGDGTQRKSYLHVQDCIEAMLHVIAVRTAQHARHRVEVYNLGTDEYCQVTDSIAWICAHLGLNPRLEFSGGPRGWIGDNPFIFLDTRKIRSTGWAPELGIQESVLRTVQWLQNNPWIFSRR
jgi:UDP-glucose 4-epimerase